MSPLFEHAEVPTPARQLIIKRHKQRSVRQFWTPRGWTFQRRHATRLQDRKRAQQLATLFRTEQKGWQIGIVPAEVADA